MVLERELRHDFRDVTGLSLASRAMDDSLAAAAGAGASGAVIADRPCPDAAASIHMSLGEQREGSEINRITASANGSPRVSASLGPVVDDEGCNLLECQLEAGVNSNAVDVVPESFHEAVSWLPPASSESPPAVPMYEIARHQHRVGHLNIT